MHSRRARVLCSQNAAGVEEQEERERSGETRRGGGAERVPDPFLTGGAAKLIVGLPHAVKELTS